MKKLAISLISIIVISITIIFFTFGKTEQRYIAEDIAKRSVQAKTFDIYKADTTTYNIFTQKYKVKLISAYENKKVYAYVSFKEDGQRIKEIEIIGLD